MQQAEKDFREALPGKADPSKFARDQFDSLDKKKVRDALRTEQKGICVYCECELPTKKDGPPIPPIEHWCSLSDHPHWAFHWHNLYLSCPTDDSCDGSKGHLPLAWAATDPHLPWPSETPYHEWLGFTRGGEIYVRADKPLDEATRKALNLAIEDQMDGSSKRASVLNLNHSALIEARKAAMDAERIRLSKEFPDETASSEAREERARALLNKNPYLAFVSARLAWLRGTLGKNKKAGA